MGRDGYEIAERLDLTWLDGSADEGNKGQSGEWRRTEGGRAPRMKAVMVMVMGGGERGRGREGERGRQERLL